MPIILALLSSLVWGLADFLGGTLSKKRKAVAVIGGSQSFGLLFASVLALIFGLWTWDTTVWVNGAIAGAMGLLGLVGFFSIVVVGILGVWFYFLSYRLYTTCEDKDAKKLMFASFVYLPVIQFTYVFTRDEIVLQKLIEHGLF